MVLDSESHLCAQKGLGDHRARPQCAGSLPGLSCSPAPRSSILRPDRAQLLEIIPAPHTCGTASAQSFGRCVCVSGRGSSKAPARLPPRVTVVLPPPPPPGPAGGCGALRPESRVRAQVGEHCPAQRRQDRHAGAPPARLPAPPPRRGAPAATSWKSSRL